MLIGDLGFLAATPWNPNPSTTQLRLVLDEFGYATPNRRPRRTRGSLDRADSATTPTISPRSPSPDDDRVHSIGQ
jgi:hypothetical protein